MSVWSRTLSLFLVVYHFAPDASALQYDITCGENGSLEEYKLKGLNEVEASIQNEALSENSIKSICENIYDCKTHLGFISDLTKSTIDVLDFMADGPIAEDLRSGGEERSRNGALLAKLNGKISTQDQKIEEIGGKQQALQGKMDEEERAIYDIKEEIKLLYQRAEMDKLEIARKEHKQVEHEMKKEALLSEKEELATTLFGLEVGRDKISEELALANKDSEEIKERMNKKLDDLKAIYAECEGNKHANALMKGNKLTIYYPYNGRGNNKTSTSYDKPSIQRLIDMALLNGVDPYFVLAITMIENSPIRTGGGSWMDNDSYAFNYGAVPVDAIAAYDQMGCLPPAEKGKTQIVQAPKKVKTLPLGTGNIKTRFCSQDYTVSTAENPRIVRSHDKAGGCCIDVIGASGASPMEVKTALGMRMLKGLQKRIPEDLDKHSDKGNYFALAYNAQRYNGLGTFGATEQMDNQCLIGVNMGERPVYGLLVQDLMANSLMSNPALREMVEKSKNKFKVPQTSALCVSFGAGKSAVDTREFLRLQKELLLNHADKVPKKKAAVEAKRKANCTFDGKVTYEPYTKEELQEKFE